MKFLYTLIISLLLFSCQEDDFNLTDSNVPEGQPARVAFTYSAPVTPQVTSRSMIDEELANRVTSLWVGVFSQATDKLTYSQVFRKTPREDNDMLLPDQGEPLYIYPSSGASYMFAVGNIDSNYGIVEDMTSNATTRITPLASLLKDVKNVQDYKNLAAVLLEPTQVTRISGNLTMSGFYVTSDQPHDGTPHSHEFFTSTSCPGSVNINPGENVLDGYIRLCRHPSYVRFNLKANPLVKLTPLSWQVLDIPALSLLAERTDLNGGDLPNGLTTNPRYPDNYNNGNEEVSFDYDNTLGCYNFDFYLFGNRRTGLSHVNNYQDRDVQFKAADGRNTRVFRSLVSEADYAASNLKHNRSPYVLIKMRAEYSILPGSNEDLIDPGQSFTPVPEGTPGSVKRMGEFTTLVHLGYIYGDTEAERAKDFNLERDHKYTYNLTVDGVDNVRVEAVSSTLERQPGLHGLVADAMTSIVDLDAHYSAFNVKITNGQRKNFRYNIRAAFGDQEIEIEDKTRAQVSAQHQEQFYDWLQFAPALDENHLAAYPGTQNYQGEKLWSLEQLADPDNYPGYREVSNVTSSTQPQKDVNDNSDAWEDRECWYTVFVNEHVYDKDLQGNPLGASGWVNYCNTSGRSCSLQVLESHTSADRDSRYLHSIIYIQQNSINTFYNTQPGQAAPDNVIGCEHDNETFGMNMIWTASTDIWQTRNGRFNTWYWLNNRNPGKYSWTRTANGKNFFKTLVTADGSKWNEQQYLPQVVFDGQVQREAGPAYMPALNPLTQNAVNHTGGLYSQYYPNPNSTDLYEPLMMAMSRNRDLNGDGEIQADELRWVIPGGNEMELVIIGSPALDNPVLDYNHAVSSLPYTAWPKELKNGLYHFITSSAEMIWGDQHMVISLANYSNQVAYKANGAYHGGDATGPYYDDNQGNYWQIRCIRPISSNMDNQVTVNDRFSTWYTRPITYREITPTADNPAIGEIDMSYFNPRCIGAPVTTAKPWHSVREANAVKSSSAFVFAHPVPVPESVVSNATWVTTQAAGANFLETTLGDGWRIPTIQELMLIERIYPDAFPDIENRSYPSCTHDIYLNRVLGIYFSGSEGGLVSNAISDVRMGSGWTKWVIPVKDVIGQ